MSKPYKIMVKNYRDTGWIIRYPLTYEELLNRMKEYKKEFELVVVEIREMK